MQKIELSAIKDKIVAGIRKKYNMSVYEFSNSDKPEQIGIVGGNSLRCYLQSKGTSFAVLQKLWKHLGLGILSREVKQIKTTTYQIVSEGKNFNIEVPKRAAGNKPVAKKTAKLIPPTPATKKKKAGNAPTPRVVSKKLKVIPAPVARVAKKVSRTAPAPASKLGNAVKPTPRIIKKSAAARK